MVQKDRDAEREALIRQTEKQSTLLEQADRERKQRKRKLRRQEIDLLRSRFTVSGQNPQRSNNLSGDTPQDLFNRVTGR